MELDILNLSGGFPFEIILWFGGFELSPRLILSAGITSLLWYFNDALTLLIYRAMPGGFIQDLDI